MGVTLLILFSFFLGLSFFLVADHVVGLGEFQDFVNVLIIVGARAFGRHGPGIEDEVEFGERHIFEKVVRTPIFVYFGEVGDHAQDVCIYFWRLLFVQIGLDIICIQEDKEQELFILVIFEERDVVGGLSEVLEGVVGALQQPAQQGTF